MSATAVVTIGFLVFVAIVVLGLLAQVGAISVFGQLGQALS